MVQTTNNSTPLEDRQGEYAETWSERFREWLQTEFVWYAGSFTFHLLAISALLLLGEPRRASWSWKTRPSSTSPRRRRRRRPRTRSNSRRPNPNNQRLRRTSSQSLCRKNCRIFRRPTRMKRDPATRARSEATSTIERTSSWAAMARRWSCRGCSAAARVASTLWQRAPAPGGWPGWSSNRRKRRWPLRPARTRIGKGPRTLNQPSSGGPDTP